MENMRTTEELQRRAAVRSNKKEPLGWLVWAGLVAVLAGTCQTQTIAVECPGYIRNTHDESAIISKLREDFASGRVKSVHHE